MFNCLVVLFVINFFQAFAAVEPLAPAHRISRRSPQQFDIQSISQKQISPDITVVDVVVNEPRWQANNNRNQYFEPVDRVYQPVYVPKNPNQYPRQNIPNRRQPEIQVIEIVDPNAGPEIYRPNNVYPGRYPQGQGQITPFTPNRGNRRPYRPNADFHIEDEDKNTNISPPTPRPNRRRRPKPKPNSQNESSEEEKYIFDAGEAVVTGYTEDNFPIIPLNKNEIRR